MPDEFVSLGEAANRVMETIAARGIEHFDITTRDEWLKWRQQDVTASTIAALLGEHEYQTRLGLYMLKTGQHVEDPEETPAMRRGRMLEPIAIQLLQEQTDWCLLPNAGKTYFRDPATRIGATPDSMWTDPARPGFGIVQVKTVEPMIFRRKWQTEKDGPIEPPFWIAVQALTEAWLTGASWAAVYPMRVGHGIEGDLIDIPIHMGAMKTIVGEVAKFWASVETKEPPPAEYGKDGKILESLYDLPPGSVVDLTGDNMLRDLAAEDERLRETIKESEKRRKEIRAEVVEKIGRARVIEENDDGPVIAMLDGEKFATSKTVHRKGYEVKPSSYRDVRIVFKGEAA